MLIILLTKIHSMRRTYTIFYPLLFLLALSSCGSDESDSTTNIKAIENSTSRFSEDNSPEKPNTLTRAVEMSKTVQNGKVVYSPVIKEGAFVVGHLMFNTDDVQIEMEQADRSSTFLKTENGIEIQVVSAIDGSQLNIVLNDQLDENGILNAKEYLMNKEQKDAELSFTTNSNGKKHTFKLKEGNLMIDMVDASSGLVIGHFHGEGWWNRPGDEKRIYPVNCDFDLHFNEL